MPSGLPYDCQRNGEPVSVEDCSEPGRTVLLTTASRGGVTNWIVGRNTPKIGEGVSTIKVKVHQGGKTYLVSFTAHK
jgi:hypothetical protein